MNIVKQDARYMDPKGYTAYQFIERIGRTCYKSEDRITDGSAVAFVRDTLLKRGHLAMLEHAHVYFLTPLCHYIILTDGWRKMFYGIEGLRYLNMSCYADKAVVSGSISAFLNVFAMLKDGAVRHDVRDPWLDEVMSAMERQLQEAMPEVFGTPEGAVDADLSEGMELVDRERFIEFAKSLPGKDRAHAFATHLTHTMLFTTNRGVTHELVRHRVASFAQESTRYVNYEKEKYGSSITVTQPPFFEPGTESYGIWKDACEHLEKAYIRLTKDLKLPAQQARDVLPNSTKSDIITTATESEWQHVINLRYHGATGAPHPEMKEVMCIAYPILVEASDGRLG